MPLINVIFTNNILNTLVFFPPKSICYSFVILNYVVILFLFIYKIDCYCIKSLLLLYFYTTKFL
ncbi:hypothetical protein C0J52_01783 [Blattella germanica]|nr:hypothetical protein C0J52_01783 [Blattella germanica]